jgi:hypothetical protein
VALVGPTLKGERKALGGTLIVEVGEVAGTVDLVLTDLLGLVGEPHTVRRHEAVDGLTQLRLRGVEATEVLTQLVFRQDADTTLEERLELRMLIDINGVRAVGFRGTHENTRVPEPRVDTRNARERSSAFNIPLFATVGVNDDVARSMSHSEATRSNHEPLRP